MQTAPFSSYKEDEGIKHFHRSYYLLYLRQIYKKYLLTKFRFFLSENWGCIAGSRCNWRKSGTLKKTDDTMHMHNSSKDSQCMCMRLEWQTGTHLKKIDMRKWGKGLQFLANPFSSVYNGTQCYPFGSKPKYSADLDIIWFQIYH